jgi:hypothetical protein
MPTHPLQSAIRFVTRSVGFIVVSTVLLPACGSVETPLAPTSIAAPVPSDTATLGSNQSADRCVNVSAEGTAALGVVTLPNGTTGFGGVWFPLTLGGIRGEMASVVVNQQLTGSNGQGAVHLALQHAFQTPTGDYLISDDRAVCAPADNDPLTCRVNDVLTIVGGTGIFSAVAE